MLSLSKPPATPAATRERGIMLAMRLLISALVVTMLVAVTASVFAIWPIVADAPWEDSSAPVVADRGDEVRCQGALDYRATIVANPPTRQRGLLGGGVATDTDQATLQRLLDQAEREIDLYC